MTKQYTVFTPSKLGWRIWHPLFHVNTSRICNRWGWWSRVGLAALTVEDFAACVLHVLPWSAWKRRKPITRKPAK